MVWNALRTKVLLGILAALGSILIVVAHEDRSVRENTAALLRSTAVIEEQQQVQAEHANQEKEFWSKVQQKKRHAPVAANGSETDSYLP
jgi:hypothetical protein